MQVRQAIARVLMFISVIMLGLCAISAIQTVKGMHTIIGPIFTIFLYILGLLSGRAVPNILQPSISISPKIRSRSSDLYLIIESNTSSWHDYGDAMICFDYYDNSFEFNNKKEEVVTLVGNDSIRLGCFLRVGKKRTISEIKIPSTARDMINSGNKDKIYVSFHFKNLLLGFQFSRYLHLKAASVDENSDN